MTKAELLKLLENYSDDADFPGLNFPGDVPFDKAAKEETVKPEDEAKNITDDFPRSKKNGFDFNGVWIDNPTLEETGRFPFKSMQDSISYYGDANANAIKNMYKELGESVADTEDEPPAAAPETKEEAPYPVYTTTDDSMLAWKDPVAFKKFVIGPLLAGLSKEEREAALKSYWKMSPEDLINNKDTAGSFTTFMSNDKDNGGAISFDEGKNDYSWDLSLRDLYSTGDDDDPFDNDLYDLLDNFNGDIEDVNGDGDPDVMTEDTNGDGEADTATVTADDEAEASEAVDSAKKSLDGDKKVEQDSTGSLNDKPSEDVSDEKLKNKKSSETQSDEKAKDKKHPEDCSCAECTKKKEQELSDSRFKNIVNTLVDKLW